MRGGRNKFGPMYKRDRARKLQLLRQKQMQQHNRSTCQLNAELSGAGGGSGNNAMSTSMANNMAYGPPSGPLYTQQGLPIKQEIQIPQLSSSTASPDSSSSSPLPTQNHHHAHHHSLHHPLVMGGSMSAPSPTTLHSSPPNSAEHHKMTTAWVAPGTPTSSTPSPNNGNVVAATNGTGCGGTSAASPSDPHSPKVFHYDGAGSVVQLSAATANGNGNGNGTTPTATSIVPGKIPSMIRDFQYSLDDKEWQSQLFGLLQSQTYNQCEVDLFELMCKVLDQSLFAQVDWARNSTFFKDLKVDDQMKLLQYSWSDMLILDHIHHRLHNSLPEETTLANGQKFDLLTLAVLGLPNLVDQFTELNSKMQELKLDGNDYVCLKFLLLLNPDVRGLVNRKHVQEAHEQVKQALLDYSLNCYQQDKFSKMLRLLPEVHMLSLRGEEYLYYKHLSGNAPVQTLLMEMLHAKKNKLRRR
uniref:NR LBD domain-containing protein n=1 Tax=Strigamia maritima TaxID=126957 RepID=T1IY60_STRMM